MGNETEVGGSSFPVQAIFSSGRYLIASKKKKQPVQLLLNSPGFPVHPLHESGLQAPKSIHSFLSF